MVVVTICKEPTPFENLKFRLEQNEQSITDEHI